MKADSFKKIFIVMVCGLMGLGSAAHALEVFIPAATVESGQTVTVPVMIDQVDNLAGIKLVMEYDVKTLAFQKAVKSKETTSLMHVVNSKNPGRVVVVMAGARGIKGKDFPIVHIDFMAQSCAQGSCPSQLKIVEAQFMSDKLKDLEYTTKNNPVVVTPAKSPRPAKDAPAPEKKAVEKKPATP